MPSTERRGRCSTLDASALEWRRRPERGSCAQASVIQHCTPDALRSALRPCAPLRLAPHPRLRPCRRDLRTAPDRGHRATEACRRTPLSRIAVQVSRFSRSPGLQSAAPCFSHRLSVVWTAEPGSPCFLPATVLGCLGASGAYCTLHTRRARREGAGRLGLRRGSRRLKCAARTAERLCGLRTIVTGPPPRCAGYRALAFARGRPAACGQRQRPVATREANGPRWHAASV